MNQQISKKDIEGAKEDDIIFRFDEDQQNIQRSGRPWKNDPRYFDQVKLSALALLKMVMHAASGGKHEIMGLMTGKIEGGTMIVLDAFASPAKGNEYAVNAGTREIEYIAGFISMSQEMGRMENCIGWYHSHPGFGCWLSGIDVNTQNMSQKFQDPWLAIVVDPITTISSGKVEIGAFRTYPEGYTPQDTKRSQYQTIPEDKIEDFGVYHNRYYTLPIELFKSSTDAKHLSLLWNQYWVSTLSSSPLISNRDFTSESIFDVCAKLRKSNNDISKKGFGGGGGRGFYRHHQGPAHFGGGDSNPLNKSPLKKVNHDNVKLSTEALNGIIGLELKRTLFNINL